MKSLFRIKNIFFLLFLLFIVSFTFLYIKYEVLAQPQKKFEPVSNSEAQNPAMGMNSLPGAKRTWFDSNSNGAKLYKQYCRACHFLSDRISTGPGFKDISKEFPDREWLFSYTKNWLALFKKGDPLAIKTANSNPNEMTIFEGTLTDEQIIAIILYITSEPGESKPVYQEKVVP